jgi:TATA-box binding protein (TBP) (component of TFIID and TFIIIB)
LDKTYVAKYENDEYNKLINVALLRSRNNKINLKIFGNGKIIVTGCMVKEQAIDAINVFVDAMTGLTDTYVVKNKPINEIFTSIITFSNYIRKYKMRIYKLMEIFNIDTVIDVRLYKKKEIENNCNILNYISGDIVNFARIIEIIKILNSYYPIDNKKDIMLQQLLLCDQEIYRVITELYQGNTILLKSTFYCETINNVEIVNHNISYKHGYNIDRNIATKILNDKYIDKLYSYAMFTQEDYQGINIPLKYEDTAKILTIILFRERIMIIGCITYEHILYAYNFINNYIKNEIYLININVVNDTKQPLIIKINNNLLVNKKWIINNPCNHVNISKYNILF